MVNPPERIDASPLELSAVIFRGPETAVADTLTVAVISVELTAVTPLIVTPAPAETAVEDVKPVPVKAIVWLDPLASVMLAV